MKKILLTVMLIGLICLMGVGSAAAITQTFETPSGSTAGGVAVHAKVTFITEDDAITVKAWNLLANPTSAGQLLTDIGFVLSTGEDDGTLTHTVGTQRTITSNTGFVDVSDVDTTNTEWALNTQVDFGSDTGLKLNALGEGQPKYGIIGPPNGSGNYSDANGSIKGATHNPYYFGTETIPVVFSLEVPGVTANTQVTFVEWSFGTTEGNIVTTPLPPTALLMGSGLLGLLGLTGWRRKGQS